MEPHTHDTAGFFSILFLWWARPYLNNPGYSTSVPAFLKPDTYYDVLKKNWHRELEDDAPSFARALRRTFVRPYCKYYSVFLVDIVAQISMGVIVGQIIGLIQEPSGYVVYWYGLGLVLSMIASQLSRHYSFLRGFLLSGVVREVILRMLHAKALRLPLSLEKDEITGKLLNLATNDADLFEFAFVIGFLVVAPVAATLIAAVLLYLIGLPGLLGILIIVLLVPIQTQINQLNAKIREKVGHHGDIRVKKTTELIEGIRILKMYGWETAFAELIKSHRRQEVKVNRWKLTIRSSNLTMFLVSQGLACLVTFVAYLLIYGSITATQIFSTLSLLLTAQFYLTMIFPVATEFYSVYKGSCQRITELLTHADQETQFHTPEDGKLRLKQVSCGFDAEILHKVNFSARPGELVFVVGPVGSGKTSLLLTILSELQLKHGKIFRQGSVAYVEQDPWILPMTLKENILLGKEYFPRKFQQVLEATGLTQDAQQLKDGIDTRLGEKGTNLSGGQKARVSLARAIYTDADIYLLDDPFSAVDVRVGRLIFNEAVLNLLAAKTRIVVTHQTHFIRPGDKVYRLEDGRLYKEKGSQHIGAPTQHSAAEDNEELDLAKDDESDDEPDVRISSFFKYIWAGWKWTIPFFVLLYPVTVALYLAVPLWLAYWSEQDDTDMFYIDVLGLIILVLFVLGIIRNLLFSHNLQTASQKLHDSALDLLVRFPISYFDYHTTGTILGRMCTDVSRLDEAVTWFFTEFMQVLFITMGSVIAMVIGNPFMLLPLIPFCFCLYYIFKQGYPNTEAYYKAFNASKGQVTTVLQVSLSGRFSIRAAGLARQFRHLFASQLRFCTGKFVSFHACNQLMNFRHDMVGFGFNLLNIVGTLLLIGTMEASLLSTGLSLTLTLILNLIWTVFLFTQTRAFLVSCVRMMNYTQLPTEAALHTEEPFKVTAGMIQFAEVCMKYNEETTALRDLSFKVRGGQRVGIVGRTGAGKSSILQALFRTVELHSGKIFIDQQDISRVGLHSLRKSLGIIPQTPFLFSASVRYNLDPLGLYEDEQLWEALKAAYLADKIQSLEDGLNTELTSNGLSAGEKQLMCLARALLKQPKILLLDEATANVDHETDQYVQKAIKKRFRKATVLIIAHRLDTIIGCERILVLENGLCVERGRPRDLLEDQSGHFYNMVQSSAYKAKHLLRFLDEESEDESLHSIIF